MRAFRVIRILGTIFIVYAIVVFIVEPSSRPGTNATALRTAQH